MRQCLSKVLIETEEKLYWQFGEAAVNTTFLFEVISKILNLFAE